MDDDVPYFYWYLNNDQRRKTRFTTIEVKGDEPSISRVDCPQGRK
jgi:hypothetical protein